MEVSIPGRDLIWAECEVVKPYIHHYRIENLSHTESHEVDYFSSSAHPVFVDFVANPKINPSDLPNRYNMTNGSCYAISEPTNSTVKLTLWARSLGFLNSEQVEILTDLSIPLTNATHSIEYGKELDHPIVKAIDKEEYFLAYYYPSLFGQTFSHKEIIYNSTYWDKKNYFVLSIRRDSLISLAHTKDVFLKCLYMSDNLYKYKKDVECMTDIKDLSEFASVFTRDNIISNINGGGIGFFGAETEETLPWLPFLSRYKQVDTDKLTPLPYFPWYKYK